MLFSEKQQKPSNPAPPSLSAGDHEMRDYYTGQDAPRPLPQQEPYLTPYLGLRARLSQTWINRWTVLLLLVLIRTLLAIATLDDNLGTARRQALSACTSVENVGSAMASMPHYMAAGTNELTAHGIERAINGLMQMLILTLTGVEEIVLFVIHMLTNTYLCLITFAVTGSLHVALSVAKDVGDFLNSTVQDVGKDLGSAAADFQKAMNGFLSGVDKIGDFFTGKDNKAPTIDLTSEINKLGSLQLPSDYDQGLNKLNASIPNFDQVQNFTDNIIRFPFEELKKLLNESLPKYTMNRSLFPVPAKEHLTFCSDNNGINNFFDDLVDIEHLAKKIFLSTLIILAILAMIPMGYRELRRWRTTQDRAAIVRTHPDSMDAVYLVSRPYTSSAGLWLSEKFSSPRRRTLVRWSVAYATTVPALFVLSLAVAGLLGCLCQYILLKSIEKEVPALTNQVVDFTNTVVNKLNNASEQWAVGTNKVIGDANRTINIDVLGWVGTSTTAVNNTLNIFVDEMTKVLNTTFGGTVLYDPIMEVLNCLILLKIKGIEQGLTWVHDNAHVDFPLLPVDTFSLGALEKMSGSGTDLLATNGGVADDITSAVYHVTNAIEKAIRQETIISACILLIWVLIALIGISRAILLGMKGGDTGVRSISSPKQLHPPPTDDKDAFRVTESIAAPSYAQSQNTYHSGDHEANRYNGQSYTLTPAPMPRFEVNTATSPILNTGFSAPNEKLGTVNGQHVDAAIRRQTHMRASSHGDVAITSPNSPPGPTPPLPSNARNAFQSMEIR